MMVIYYILFILSFTFSKVFHSTVSWFQKIHGTGHCHGIEDSVIQIVERSFSTSSQ